MSENFNALYSYINSLSINIDKEEFKYQVETHPDYPSLLAFSDALTFFNIPNLAFKLPFEEMESLPNSFLALLNKDNQSSLNHITQIGDSYYSSANKSVKISRQELKPIWENIVLLAEASMIYKAEENKSKLPLNFMLAFLGALILFSIYFFSQSAQLTLFSLLPATGIFLSIEALKTELGIESKVSQTFCNAIKNADCSQVINSTKNKWLQKIKISDISFWFFCSQLLTILMFSASQFFNNFFSLMFIGLLLSLPMTFYSVYFQYKIENKWCPICLSIIGIVYLEVLMLFIFNYKFHWDLKSFLLFFTIFSLVAGIVYILKPIFFDRKEITEKYIKLVRFSKNYTVFKNTLKNSQQQFFKKEFILLGNPASKKKISIVTSPLCGFCNEAHQIIEQILNQHSDDIAISVRFNFDENFDEKTKNIFLRLGEIYETNGDEEFIVALKTWFNNKNFDNWFQKFGNPEIPHNIYYKLSEVAQENAELGLNFTPIFFLNQYNYPSEYARESLVSFIADWLEDEEL